MAVGIIRDQSYIKFRNIQTVLTLLSEHQPISRTEIAAMTEMSPTSITRIIGALLSLSLVEEARSESSGKRGRKALNLVTRAEGIRTAGILLEPHRIRLGLIDFHNTLHCVHEVPVDGASAASPEMMATIARTAMNRLISGENQHLAALRAVGISVAGTVDCDAGIVTQSDQLGWQDARVSEAFEAAFSLPAYVENDVKACLVGEKVRRGIPQREDTAYLLIGSGVGMAITANGKVVRGKRNEAGEIGLIPLGDGSHLDDHLVERALIRRAKKAEPSVSIIDDVLLAYRQDVLWARMLLGDFRRALVTALEIIKGVCDPQHVILGGTIVPKLLDLFGEDLQKPGLFIGDNYGDACIIGAGIIAQQQAVQTLIGQELGT